MPGSPVVVDWETANAAVAELNEYRIGANVPPVELDTTLSYACQRHANYLAINEISLNLVGLGAHDEDSSLPGYSATGAVAGSNSVIYEGVEAVEAIDNWMATFYHRLGLLDPNLVRVGFGSAGGYQVMDVRQGMLSGGDIVSTTVLFPSPGMTNAPWQYRREIPHPITGDESLGVPITVEFTGMLAWDLWSVQASLHDLETGDEVAIYLQVPGDPFLKGWDAPQLIALIPQNPLARERSYRVKVNAEVDYQIWKAEWDFTTQ